MSIFLGDLDGVVELDAEIAKLRSRSLRVQQVRRQIFAAAGCQMPVVQLSR
jgi:hypothetical protein